MEERDLLKWFDDSTYDFLSKHAKDRLSSLNNDYVRLKRLLDEPETVTVCFLGNSGIGKSTLLNAVAADAEQILPSGGIGPLTAQATEVHYSEEHQFEVTYHRKKHLWNVVFALEQSYMAQRKKELGATENLESGADIETDISLEVELEDEDKAEIIAAIEPDSEQGEKNDKLEAFIKQANIIVTGEQFGKRSLPYLIDALRIACDVKAKWSEKIDPDDIARIDRVKRILGKPKGQCKFLCRRSDNPALFKSELYHHAAGFLSPLIERISVGWTSPVLQSGVVLVDLPGVGIAQDSYRDVTKGYVRDKARAVIMVVDRAGPTESTVDLLRDSGYWQRLVGSADDPDSDPCTMLMAITKVDDVAGEEYRNYQQEEGEVKPKKWKFFEKLMEEFKPRMRKQISDQLAKINASDNDAVNDARETARNTILSTMEVHPVSAPELRKIILDDDGDPPFLKSKEQTGVPQLQESLIRFAKSEREKRHDRIREVSARFSSSLLNELKIIDNLWRQEGRAAEEAARLEAALSEILAPKRKEYDRRVGAFREFLTETVQTKIEALVLEARSVAEKEVQAYLWSLQGAHWTTLRAAVRRGGAFHGSRIINLPDDISGYFQEPMAAVWGQKLLRDVRNRTSTLSKDIEVIVTEICDWAKEHGGASINRTLLEHQQERIAHLADQMKQVGKEAVDELRTTVKSKLTDAIRKPIKSSCEKFVDSGNHIGTGVKARILHLFSELARQATVAAQKPAKEILQENFSRVRDEIQNAFNDSGDHIQSTADLIVERHEARVKRSDSQKRGPILAELQVILSKYPDQSQIILEEEDSVS